MERVFRGCVAQQDGYKVPVDIENESPINDLPSDPCDLVGNDLAVTPAVLSAIDRGQCISLFVFVLLFLIVYVL